METADELRGLIWHDDVAVQRALGVIMQRCGYEHLQVAGSFDEARAAVECLHPNAVVLDLALTDELGIQAVPALLEASPTSLVVVLSPFTALRQRACQVGALGLVDPRDLRHVEDWLLLGRDPHHPCR